MATTPSSLSCKRSRLARRLGLRALAGLTTLAVVVAGLGLAAAWLVGATWGALVAGEIVQALVCAAAFMVAVAAATLCTGWLFAPTARPDGIRLPREAAESLHSVVEHMGRRCGHIPIDALWVVGDMNVAILQRPRWGWLGPMETHLMIGLPLAHSVSRRQFSAILAHEFAHLALQRQGFDAWWGHLRAWWFRSLDRAIEDMPNLARLLESWSEADLRDAVQLSRLEEFEADAMAARIVGARQVGEALVEVALKERFLNEDYWRKVMEQSRSNPQPLIRPFREMGLGVMAGFRRPTPGKVDIHDMFGGAASSADFHPTLCERLRSLGVMPTVPRGDATSLAAACLSPLLPTLAWIFDRAWWQDSRRDWRRRYEGCCEE